MITFRDTDQNEWQVFQVVPGATSAVERRRVDRRRGPSAEYNGPERRAGTERRRVRDGLDQGWLCFVSGDAKCRLFGFPEQWRDLDERRLRELLERAKPAPSRLMA